MIFGSSLAHAWGITINGTYRGELQGAPVVSITLPATRYVLVFSHKVPNTAFTSTSRFQVPTLADAEAMVKMMRANHVATNAVNCTGNNDGPNGDFVLTSCVVAYVVP